MPRTEADPEQVACEPDRPKIGLTGLSDGKARTQAAALNPVLVRGALDGRPVDNRRS